MKQYSAQKIKKIYAFRSHIVYNSAYIDDSYIISAIVLL